MYIRCANAISFYYYYHLKLTFSRADQINEISLRTFASASRLSRTSFSPHSIALSPLLASRTSLQRSRLSIDIFPPLSLYTRLNLPRVFRTLPSCFPRRTHSRRTFASRIARLFSPDLASFSRKKREKKYPCPLCVCVCVRERVCVCACVCVRRRARLFVRIVSDLKRPKKKYAHKNVKNTRDSTNRRNEF